MPLAKGAKVVIAEINDEKAGNVVDEGKSAGDEAIAGHIDVADYESVQAVAVAEAVEETYGRIDVLVNNTAFFSTIEMRPFDDIPLDERNRVIRINLTGVYSGVYYCTRAVIPAMRKRQWGRTINKSSATG